MSYVTLEFITTASLFKIQIFLTLFSQTFLTYLATDNSDLVVPDIYHPPVVIVLNISLASCLQSLYYLFHRYACGSCSVLYETVSSCDWSCVFRRTSTHSAVNQLNSVVADYLNQAILYIHIFF
jgi:hypothetical protein